MAKCFSFTASIDWFHRHLFFHSGLRSISTDIGDGTTMSCWVPQTNKPSKPSHLLRHFKTKCNIYVPNLLFLGSSFTAPPERTESYQVECVLRLMNAHGVKRMSLVGVSYGGFVGYSLAVQSPEAVEKVVLCGAGVAVEEKDMVEGLLAVEDIEKECAFVSLALAKRILIPSCCLSDFVRVSIHHPL